MIFSTLLDRVETSNRVRKMMAQLVAILGRQGRLEGSDGNDTSQRSRDFIEFIVRLCALPPSKDSNEATRFVHKFYAELLSLGRLNFCCWSDKSTP